MAQHDVDGAWCIRKRAAPMGRPLLSGRCGGIQAAACLPPAFRPSGAAFVLLGAAFTSGSVSNASVASGMVKPIMPSLKSSTAKDVAVLTRRP